MLLSFGITAVILVGVVACFWLWDDIISTKTTGSGPDSSSQALVVESQLDEALEELRNTPGTILISSVPLGVDVFVDEHFTYSPSLPGGRTNEFIEVPEFPKAPENDPRYVGRTPVIVPRPAKEAAIYFSYPVDQEDSASLKQLMFLPSDECYMGVSVFYPRNKWRNVIVLLDKPDPKKPLHRSTKYTWPSKPHFSDWNTEGLRSNLASHDIPSSEVDQILHQLLCNGIATLDTSTGRIVYLLTLGDDGTVSGFAVTPPKGRGSK